MRSSPAVAAVALCALFSTPGLPARDWPQFGYEPGHSGNNPDETAISAANVAQMTRRYMVTLPELVDSAPVYASAVQTPDGIRNLIFLTAKNSKLLAVDASNGAVVWSKATANTTTQSSPAIDPDRQFVYAYGGDGKAHKYAIGDGTETLDAHWPQVATLKPSVEKGAGALATATSGGVPYLYVVNDGYIGDQGDYQGHLTTINLATGAQSVFNSLCSDKTIHLVAPSATNCSSRQSGIWGRPGATYDAATDRVYITTGNGEFNANMGGFNWADSVLALHPDGTGGPPGTGLPVDSYTPTEYDELQGGDTDLGSASLIILPAPAGSTVAHIGLQHGKDSKLRLIDLDNMSGTGAPGGVGGEIEVINVPISEFWPLTQPATWTDTGGDGSTWVFMANGTGISGLRLTLTAANVPHLQPTWQKNNDSTSAIVANNVLYQAGSCTGGTCLIARNPLDGTVLWTSATIGSLHWQSPILVDGALYIAVGTKLHRFDLGDAGGSHTVTPSAGPDGSMAPSTPQTVLDGEATAFVVTPDAHHAIDTVTGCGGSLNGDTFTTAPIVADCTVTATFVAITHTVTPPTDALYNIDPATPQAVIDGGSADFTITLAPGPYRIGVVTGCPGNLAGSVFTAGPVDADCAFEVTVIVDDADFVFHDGFDPL